MIDHFDLMARARRLLAALCGLLLFAGIVTFVISPSDVNAQEASATATSRVLETSEVESEPTATTEPKNVLEPDVDTRRETRSDDLLLLEQPPAPLEADPEVLKEFNVQSAVADPVNPLSRASGPIPEIETMIVPAGTQPSGTTRTFTVAYTNDGDKPIVQARIWHQLLVATHFDATFEVNCKADGGAVCPTEGLPIGPQSVSGTRQDYTTTFWGVVDMPVSSGLTFTIEVTASVKPGTCGNSNEVMFGGYGRYSDVGFQMPGDIKSSASSVGMMSEVPSCDSGAVTISNTVTSPVSNFNGAPLRVLSGDERTFVARWTNETNRKLTLPISYSYYVPYTEHHSEVVWTCESSLDVNGDCPEWGSGHKGIKHDNPGEEPDQVFEGEVTLEPEEILTFTIRITTTLNRCTQDGVLRVQTYAGRQAATGEEDSFRDRAESQLVEIGCASWIVQENFTSNQVKDPNWIAANDACLTASTSDAAPGKLGKCKRRRHLPAVDFYKNAGSELPAGFLALTEDYGGALASDHRSGSVLYNRPLPTKNGIVIEFDQYQYGANFAGYNGDGIGFYLVDGSRPLDQPGPAGASLGYAAKPKDGPFPAKPGVSNGYLGVGFDATGNYASSSDKVAPKCGVLNGTPMANSVTLRGPGNGFDGYCPVGESAALGELQLRKHIGIAGSSNWWAKNFPTHLSDAKRKTRITVYPFHQLSGGQRVTVEIDFGYGLERIFDELYKGTIPSTFKFGISASTGLYADAHLISNMRVGTVLPLDPLDLTKAVTSDAKSFAVGETIDYEFVLFNKSGETVTNVAVNDPLIKNVSCPGTTISGQNSMTCKGTLTVSEEDAERGRVVNEATARGFVDLDPRASSTSKAVAVVKPVTPDITQKVVPTKSVDFVLTTLEGDYAPPSVKPSDPARVKVEFLDANKQPLTDVNSLTVEGEGIWEFKPGNLVTFTHKGSKREITPLHYRITNTFGGVNEGTLNIQVAEGLTNMRVEKLAKDGTPLTGAEFVILDGNKTEIPLALIEESGQFRLNTVLEPGTYYLRETKAPEGHSLLAKDVELQYSQDGKLTASEPVQVTYENMVYLVRVTNASGTFLPLTGGAGTWGLTLGGVVLLTLVSGIAMRRSKESVPMT
ncbi:DUF7507 domain-containing protein [Corynebacterium hindlerae]|uniref:DUF7507 domain-containing protein n=1 Tax=Corynebacterium hindlerae TaxID=699041 RepID=UPI0031B73657